MAQSLCLPRGGPRSIVVSQWATARRDRALKLFEGLIWLAQTLILRGLHTGGPHRLEGRLPHTFAAECLFRRGCCGEWHTTLSLCVETVWSLDRGSPRSYLSNAVWYASTVYRGEEQSLSAISTLHRKWVLISIVKKTVPTSTLLKKRNDV